MLMPSIFGENLFDDFFDGDFPFYYDDRAMRRYREETLRTQSRAHIMKTDIKETG